MHIFFYSITRLKYSTLIFNYKSIYITCSNFLKNIKVVKIIVTYIDKEFKFKF